MSALADCYRGKRQRSLATFQMRQSLKQDDGSRMRDNENKSRMFDRIRHSSSDREGLRVAPLTASYILPQMQNKNLLIIASSEKNADLYYATNSSRPIFCFCPNLRQKYILVSDLEIDRAKKTGPSPRSVFGLTPRRGVQQSIKSVLLYRACPFISEKTRC